MMKNIIIDGRIEKEIRYNLTHMGFNIIESFVNNNLYEAVKSHVDMSLYYDGLRFVSSVESYEFYRSILKNKEIIKGNTTLTKKYPEDISYNVCFTGKYAIGNTKHIDGKLLKYIESRDIEIIDIKQGYANCSICQVDESSVITSDLGIYDTLKYKELDVLLIEKGHINLFDLNYGFIGGASGKLSEDEIAFFGNIKLHPNGEEIVDFIEKKGKKAISLSEGRLCDYGSCIVF